MKINSSNASFNTAVQNIEKKGIKEPSEKDKQTALTEVTLQLQANGFSAGQIRTATPYIKQQIALGQSPAEVTNDVLAQTQKFNGLNYKYDPQV